MKACKGNSLLCRACSSRNDKFLSEIRPKHHQFSDSPDEEIDDSINALEGRLLSFNFPLDTHTSPHVSEPLNFDPRQSRDDSDSLNRQSAHKIQNIKNFFFPNSL